MDSLIKLEGILENVNDGGRRLRRLYARRPDLFVSLPESEREQYRPTLQDLDGSGFDSLREWDGEVESMEGGL